MVSINFLKNITSFGLKNILGHTPPIRVPLKPTNEIIEYPRLLTQDVVEFSPRLYPQIVEKEQVLQKAELIFDDVLEGYNATKLAAAAKRGRTEKVLDNWRESYGIANAEGVFENAINKLKKDGKIDEYIDIAFPNVNTRTRAEAKEVLTKYLENNFEIYSYDRIKNILKDFSKQIQKTGENTIIYVPDKNKSYGIISSLYKEANPNANVIVGWKNLKDYTAVHPHTNVAILDDCLITGNSAQDVYNSIMTACGNINRVDMYVCAAYKKGIDYLKKTAPALNIHYDGAAKKTLEETDFFKNLIIMVGGKPKTVKQDFLKTLLRCQDTTQGYSAGTAIMFPYMSPNNNSLFSANMIQHLFSGPQFAIKNIEKTIVSKEGRLEYPPRWLIDRLNS